MELGNLATTSCINLSFLSHQDMVLYDKQNIKQNIFLDMWKYWFILITIKIQVVDYKYKVWHKFRTKYRSFSGLIWTYRVEKKVCTLFATTATPECTIQYFLSDVYWHLKCIFYLVLLCTLEHIWSIIQCYTLVILCFLHHLTSICQQVMRWTTSWKSEP